MSIFFSLFIKFFFIMTPFFVFSMFLSMTKGLGSKEKRRIAIKVTIAVLISSLILLYFGKYLFDLFGITLDAFKIGAGLLLFMNAVELVKQDVTESVACPTDISKHTIVPLAIPITVGPGTIGALMVMGAEMTTVSQFTTGSFAVILAILCVGLMLYLSGYIEKVTGDTGLLILSKITGLILSALSAQLIFSGIKNFLNL